MVNLRRSATRHGSTSFAAGGDAPGGGRGPRRVDPRVRGARRAPRAGAGTGAAARMTAPEPASREPTGPRLLRGAESRPTCARPSPRMWPRSAKSTGSHPRWRFVIVGRDAPSTVYLHKILDGCRTVGIVDRLVELSEDAGPHGWAAAITGLNADPGVAGIIVQMPLPPSIPLRTVIDVLDPAKDIDGIHPSTRGSSSSATRGSCGDGACPPWRSSSAPGSRWKGRRAVVVGRSNIVGKPAALLLLREHATVTICHSRTVDLARHVQEADIVIVAVGRPGLNHGRDAPAGRRGRGRGHQRAGRPHRRRRRLRLGPPRSYRRSRRSPAASGH